jgi:hypothetical protein
MSAAILLPRLELCYFLLPSSHFGLTRQDNHYFQLVLSYVELLLTAFKSLWADKAGQSLFLA